MRSWRKCKDEDSMRICVRWGNEGWRKMRWLIDFIYFSGTKVFYMPAGRAWFWQKAYKIRHCCSHIGIRQWPHFDQKHIFLCLYNCLYASPFHYKDMGRHIGFLFINSYMNFMKMVCCWHTYILEKTSLLYDITQIYGVILYIYNSWLLDFLCPPAHQWRFPICTSSLAGVQKPFIRKTDDLS